MDLENGPDRGKDKSKERLLIYRMGGTGREGSPGLVSRLTWTIILTGVLGLVVLGQKDLLHVSINPSCMGLEDLAYVNHTMYSSGEFDLKVTNPGLHPLNITTVNVTMGERWWEWDAYMYVSPSAEVTLTNEMLDHGLEPGTTYKFKIVVEFIQSELEHSDSASCMGQVQGTKWT